ncbi:MAG TPA: LLM class flavin-dependent oxidoreductase [Thermoanaerobaculia bacterium]|nr:LLM class flavin-dependent oxidoreductase [Thermoanaerobaculia bacterium]
MALRFHWMLAKGGEATGGVEAGARIVARERRDAGLPDLEHRTAFCRQAEACGIDSVLMSFSYYEPDTLLLAAALGLATRTLRFIAAYRSGLQAPTFFVQQVNTLSALIGGRVAINLVAGHSPEEQRYYGDFLSHDERYQRSDELLTVCRALWRQAGPVDFAGRYYRVEAGRLGTPFVAPDREAPEIYVGGHSQAAQDLVVRQASCWLCMGDAPAAVARRIRPVREQGKEAGLRLGMIVRPTRDEALAAAADLIRDPELRRRETSFVSRSDSSSLRVAEEAASEWIAPAVWTGAVPYFGAPAISLVGTPEEVASAILDFAAAGVTQFIFHGWPKLDEMVRFGRDVLPLVRVREDKGSAVPV